MNYYLLLTLFLLGAALVAGGAAVALYLRGRWPLILVVAMVAGAALVVVSTMMAAKGPQYPFGNRPGGDITPEVQQTPSAVQQGH
jgi:hypothetical protein